jgi:hypothetical protein
MGADGSDPKCREEAAARFVVELCPHAFSGGGMWGPRICRFKQHEVNTNQFFYAKFADMQNNGCSILLSIPRDVRRSHVPRRIEQIAFADLILGFSDEVHSLFQPLHTVTDQHIGDLQYDMPLHNVVGMHFLEYTAHTSDLLFSFLGSLKVSSRLHGSYARQKLNLMFMFDSGLQRLCIQPWSCFRTHKLVVTSFSNRFYPSKNYISKSENASVVASRQLIKTLESEFSWTEQGLREVPWYDTWRLY